MTGDLWEVEITKEDIQMANKHIERWLTSVIIREMQINTMMTYNLILIRMVASNTNDQSEIRK